ncbi:carboxypeptidase-like regulatory domain-containing protein, partial [Prevotella conceptionensis]|uniref:carboxypeptidase-like regulatory domain-containing protein n=1 Tax=Prevotella conceptionensis TaxID=340486 RepID=UPI0005C6249C
MNKYALLLFSLCSVPLSALAQGKHITGKVSDTKAEPIVGAVIKIQNKAAVVTDAEGRYAIDAEPGDVLDITCIGMQSQRLKVGNRSTL